MININIAILTSGGDAPGMNACIRAITKAAISQGDRVFAIYNGYKGILENNIKEFNRYSVAGIIHTGGTILGTARYNEFKDENVRRKASEKLRELQIDKLICLGGDGTYMGGIGLHKLGIECVCIPCTIDNDIASTDFTIGFSTALATVSDAIIKLRDTSVSHQRCSIIEVMGRNCSDIAFYSAIAGGAEYVISKKTGFKKEELIERIKKDKRNGKRHLVIVISELITDTYELAKDIEKASDYETRATVLGYIQRGGTPTVEDRILASRLGCYAVDLLHKGISGVAVGIRNNKLVNYPVEEALTMKKPLDEYLDEIERLIR